MGANPLRRRHPAAAQEPVQRSDGGEARLWHLGKALAVSFTVAVVGLAGLAWLAWVLLGLAGYRHHGAPALKDTVGVLQLVFATVAGAGALVALIVAYRRQKIAEADSVHDRTRVFNERFTAIAAQLGDAQPAVRLAGVHAMAGLADDWKQNRQTCVDVLCAYLRLPYDPDPGDDADPAERTAYRANREVRHTIIRLIGAHLRPGAAVSWQGLNFDFTGVVFDGGDFSAARFSGGTCQLQRRRVLRRHGQLRRRRVLRRHGQLQRRRVLRRHGPLRRRRVLRRHGRLRRRRVLRRRGRLRLRGTVASRRVLRRHGQLRPPCSPAARSASLRRVLRRRSASTPFSGGRSASARQVLRRTVDFGRAEFSGSEVDFGGAEFSGGQVSFTSAVFSGGEVGFNGAGSRRQVSFDTPGSPAARSTSPVLGAGHIRRCLAGTANRRRGWCYRFSRPRKRGASSSKADERRAETRGSGTVTGHPLSSGATTAVEHSASHVISGTQAMTSRASTYDHQAPLPRARHGAPLA